MLSTKRIMMSSFAALAVSILALCLMAAFAAPAHAATTGWKLRDGGTKLVYVQKDGTRAKSCTIDGIKIGADGYAKKNTAGKLKIAFMKNVKRITKTGMTKREKLYACYLDVLKLHYSNSEPSYYGEKDWMPRFALAKANSRTGECVYVAVLVAYYAYELGYNDVAVWAAKDSHAFTMVGDKAIDMNYALFMGKPQTSVKDKTKWVITSWATTSPKGVTKTQRYFQSHSGLTEYKGHLYYVKNGKPIKDAWKKVKGKKYYFDSKGRAVTGSYMVGDKWYVFSKTGRLMRGTRTHTVFVLGVNYRVKKSGRAAPGWNAEHTKYYLVNGARAKGLCCTGRTISVFTSSKGTFRADKTAKIRGLMQVGGRAEELIDALAAIETPKVKTIGDSCYDLEGEPDVLGKDRRYTYTHLVMDVFVAEDGRLILEGISAR